MILHKGNQKVIKSNQREKLKTTNLRWLWRFLKGFDSPTDYLYFLFHKTTGSARNALIAGRYKIYQNSAEKREVIKKVIKHMFDNKNRKERFLYKCYFSDR